MKPHIFSSLKARLVLVLIVLAIPVGGFIGFDLAGDFRTAIADKRGDLTRIALAVAQRQRSVLFGMQDVLLALATRRAAAEGDWAQCSAEFARFQQGAVGIARSGIVLADGLLRCSGLGSPAGLINLGRSDWFHDAEAGGDDACWHGYQPGDRGFTLATALGDSGSERKVAFIAIDLDWLRFALLNNLRPLAGSHLAVLGCDGTVIIDGPGGGPGVTDGAALKHAAAAPDGLFDDGDFVAAVQHVAMGARPALVIVALMPLATIIGPPRQHFLLALASVLGCAALVIALAWSITDRSISRPIGRIGAAVTSLAKGSPGSRVGAAGGVGEIAALGRSFDEMARTLDERNARLADAIARLQEALDRLNAVINASPAAIICLDTEARVMLWNPAAERIFGWSAEEAIGHPHPVVPAAERDNFQTYFDRTLGGQSIIGARGRREARDGRAVEVLFNSAPLHDAAGKRMGVLYVVNDVTAQVDTEKRLQQALKMEAVGQLTGGIAHDFNNLLSVAIGNLDLLNEFAGKDPATEEYIGSALAACLRGGDLTRQLLAFARRQPLRPEPIQPGEAVGSMARLLDRTLGEPITLRLRMKPGLWRIIADPTQLETAILNLALNARDAMPAGGVLAIDLENASLEAGTAGLDDDVQPGDYVQIAVSDTGHGMNPDVVARAFDPFFTTKDAGRGTGLGLSMVYGFIRQSGGHIRIYSEPGHGTTIKLWLPRATIDGAPPPPAPVAAIPRGDEAILVVEDDPSIRRIVVAQLAGLGYRPVEAADAAAAIEILKSAQAIDLLFTDLLMPGGTDGRTLARLAVALRPGLRVLFTSGFTDSVGTEPLSAPLLEKPYRKQQLAQMIRDILGTSGTLISPS